MRYLHPTTRSACLLTVVSTTLLVWLALGAVPASAQTEVTVAPGDTLFGIALEHSTTVSALVQANGLESPELIFIGQQLVIPRAGDFSTQGPSSAGGTHVVKAGETLSQIASLYGTSPSVLAEANDLWSADLIYVGQELVIRGQAGYEDSGTVAGTSGRSILVDLSSQQLHAVENGSIVASFTVSTGKPSTPTPIGSYEVYTRYPMQRMVGVDYDLPNVTHVQYFSGPYSFHGTYWHSDFGTPVSHGCINLRPADAEWLWSWTGIGTPVIVRW